MRFIRSAYDQESGLSISPLDHIRRTTGIDPIIWHDRFLNHTEECFKIVVSFGDAYEFRNIVETDHVGGHFL